MSRPASNDPRSKFRVRMLGRVVVVSTAVGVSVGVIGDSAGAAKKSKTTATTIPAPIGNLAGLKPSTVALEGGGSFPEVAFDVRYKDARGKDKTFCGCALLAVTSPQQQQGLMRRRDLGGYDAMIFSFAGDTNGQFYMKTVPMDLSIGFFSDKGKEVGRADMKSEGDCGQTCPLYGPKSFYRSAVEVQKGKLASIGLVPGARLSYGGPCTKKNNRPIVK
jgi:uncharacterized membrane protein (UPF0127 family)